jgi:hypothetical protein
MCPPPLLQQISALKLLSDEKDPAIGAPGQNSLARAGATVVYFRIATFSGPGSSLGKLLMSAARP